ncbi:MAG: YdbH domain-containing protein [Phycisphaeraceae bacterium]|nr:YdbH domain-containing protein [Phycisphaeraceae bacterium]
MKRPGIHPGRRLRKAIILIALALVLILIFRIQLVRWAVIAILSFSGFPNANLRVDSVTLNAMALSDLQLDPAGRVTIAHVDISYSPWQLLRGHADQVHLRTLRGLIQIDQGKIDAGPLQPWLIRQDSSAPGSPAANLKLPIKQLTIQDAQISLQSPQKKLDITFQAQITQGDSLTMELQVQPILIEDRQLPADLFPQVSDWWITGSLQAQGTWTHLAGKWTQRLQVKFADVDLRSATTDVAAEGLEGELTFDNISPLSTAPSQHLLIKAAHTGRLALHDGQIDLRLESPQSIFVERMRWRWGTQGSVWAHAFRVHPTKLEVDAELFIEAVNIQDLLALAMPSGSQSTVTGGGLLYGRLPVSIHPQERDPVRLGAGFLFAQPGGGWFRFRDKAALEGTLGLTDGSVGGQIRQKVTQALSDFVYSHLECVISKENGETVIHLSTQGQGREGSQPLEIGSLTVNIRGLETAFNELLRPRRGSDQALDNALDRLLPQ